jgi:hypothetical protein
MGGMMQPEERSFSDAVKKLNAEVAALPPDSGSMPLEQKTVINTV